METKLKSSAFEKMAKILPEIREFKKIEVEPAYSSTYACGNKAVVHADGEFLDLLTEEEFIKFQKDVLGREILAQEELIIIERGD